MGGSGSGRWYRWDTRRTVERCRVLDVTRWAREGVLRPDQRAQGAWVWLNAAGERLASIGYEVDTHGPAPWVQLTYTYGSERVSYRIALTTTRPRFGGVRWWFCCPLVVEGRPCGRRVGKLYLGGVYFGCRTCYNLAYTSSQESHQTERLARALGIDPRVMKALERRWF